MGTAVYFEPDGCPDFVEPVFARSTGIDVQCAVPAVVHHFQNVRVAVMTMPGRHDSMRRRKEGSYRPG